MSDYYFEFSNEIVEQYNLKGKILCAHDISLKLTIKYLANRIWRETDGKVYWIKNRQSSVAVGCRLDNQELDEFVWIKLQAHNI